MPDRGQSAPTNPSAEHPSVSSQQEIEDRVLRAVMEFVASLNSGGRVAADMSPLLEATSCLSLSNLDEWERLIRRGAYQANNHHKQSKWRLWSTPTPFPTWIDLCNGDGFQRERTLRALGGPAPNGFFFAMIVRRLNDWVPQVRSAAREKLLSVAVASDPVDVVAVLCSILPHWNSWGRMELADKQVLLNIASIEAVAQGLKAHLSLTAAGPLASVLSQAGRTPALDAHLPDLASNAVQPAVRARAYRALLDGKMVWLEGRKWEWIDIRYCKGQLKAVHGERPLAIEAPLATTLKAAASDRSALVRSVAGAVLIRDAQRLGPVALQLAGMFAADKSPSLSARGNFLLKSLTQTSGELQGLAPPTLNTNAP